MEKITDDEKMLCNLLKTRTDFFDNEDRCGIGILMRYCGKTKEMCDWLKNNSQATRDEIYDKADELAGIEPLSDEEIDNLSEEDYILKDENEDDEIERISKEIDKILKIK